VTDSRVGTGSAQNLRVLIVQDHPMLATAIAEVIEGAPDMTVSGIARTGTEAAAVAAREKVDVALIDFRLPDVSGPAAAIMIRTATPETVIVFQSAEESETDLLDAIDAGATAYLTKSTSAEEIVEAVRRAAQGEVLIPVELFAKAIARQRKVIAQADEREAQLAAFTPRELDVLHLLARGLDTATIAKRLGIAPHTVEWHVRHLIEKLQVHSKLQAVVEAARRGLIEV
jgi:two-component system nitrate/nitrite response regulator NarL